MARNNAINNRSSELTIDPGASGDSWTQFDINASNKFRMGSDDSDSDAFVISIGNALGTSNAWKTIANGTRTLPLQPAFLNTINTENNVTGDGTLHSIGSVTATTSVFDQGGYMTEGDGAGTPARFTAPVDGIYFFVYTLNWFCAATAGGQSYAQISSSGGTAIVMWSLPTRNQVTNFYGSVTGRFTRTGFEFLKMTGGDAATFTMLNGGASKTSDVISGQMAGYLME